MIIKKIIELFIYSINLLVKNFLTDMIIVKLYFSRNIWLNSVTITLN